MFKGKSNRSLKALTYQEILYVLILVMLINPVTGQNTENNFQYGVALKATIDLNGVENNGKYSNFNLALFGGIGGAVFRGNIIYPTLHAGCIIYNRGELLSNYKKGFLNSSVLDLMVDLTMNFGVKNENRQNRIENLPLIHFSDFASNPLQNPFQNSLSIGSNLIWSTQSNRKFQRVGFTGVMIERVFQISTYNDGAIWGRLGLGDKEDRYYTGGGLLGVYLNKNDLLGGFDSLEFSFHKFTGYEESTFHTGEILQLDFIPYKNKETKFFNKGRLRFILRNSLHNYGLHLTFHNTDRDFQDGIHFNQESPYHPDIFDNRRGVKNELKRIGIGGFMFVNSLKNN